MMPPAAPAAPSGLGTGPSSAPTGGADLENAALREEVARLKAALAKSAGAPEVASAASMPAIAPGGYAAGFPVAPTMAAAPVPSATPAQFPDSLGLAERAFPKAAPTQGSTPSTKDPFAGL